MHNSCTFIFNINKKHFINLIMSKICTALFSVFFYHLGCVCSIMWSSWGPFKKNFFSSIKHSFPYNWFITTHGLANNPQLLLTALLLSPTLSFLSVSSVSGRDGHVSDCLSLLVCDRALCQSGNQACHNSSVLSLLHATLNLTSSLWYTHLYILLSILQQLANCWSSLHFGG